MKKQFENSILIFFITLILPISCKIDKTLMPRPEVIAYRFPDKVEQLLLAEIIKEPNKKYGILIKEDDQIITISLINKFSFFHKKTSYRVLIGKKYYPVSFPQFDMRFGITENAKTVLKRKITNQADFLTKKSYPMYHGTYKIILGKNLRIRSANYVY